MNRDRITFAYCVLALCVSWALQYAALALVGDPESAAATPWLLAAMATPGLLALAFMIASPGTRGQVLWRPTLRGLMLVPAAVLVPTFIAFAGVAIIVALGWGHSRWFEFARDGVTISRGPWLLGLGQQRWPWFSVNVALTGAAYALISAIPACGEEFGWRGFLQGRLIERFGLRRGIVVLGTIWAFWHLPAQAAGYNFPDHPLLGAFVLSPIELAATSFFLAWLTLRARGFWPAALAHGAGNSIQAGVTGSLQLDVPRIYGHVVTLALTLAVGCLCLLLLESRRRSDLPAGRKPRALDPHPA
ncbi:MAG TPA: type II CAAX endopeptidase family protein [Rudaea sp.]|nr:type II CAAX endopeptidase family protein [Rudaea sp.]